MLRSDHRTPVEIYFPRIHFVHQNELHFIKFQFGLAWHPFSIITFSILWIFFFCNIFVVALIWYKEQEHVANEKKMSFDKCKCYFWQFVVNNNENWNKMTSCQMLKSNVKRFSCTIFLFFASVVSAHSKIPQNEEQKWDFYSSKSRTISIFCRIQTIAIISHHSTMKKYFYFKADNGKNCFCKSFEMVLFAKKRKKKNIKGIFRRREAKCKHID